MENINIYDRFSVQKLDSCLVSAAKETPAVGLHLLSNLDQIYLFPIDTVFTYSGNGTGTGKGVNVVEVLKKALAESLVEYYPLVGRLTTGSDGKMTLRCTEADGVPFVEAISENEMEILGDITNIDTFKLRKLVHSNDKAESILDVPPLTVQVTKFNCGGIALGVAFNHVVIDCVAFINFLTSWSETARGLPLSLPPFIDRSILSPRRPPIISILHHEFKRPDQNPLSQLQKQKEPLISKSFCFTATKLAELRKMAMEEGNIPTNFEVISALIWINWIKAFEINPEKTTKLLTAVDGRLKTHSPPLIPKGYFGNGIVASCAQSNAGDLTKKPFSFGVKIVREALKQVTEEHIRSTIDHYEVTRTGLEYENTLWITKWSRLPFYKIDFGWGKPVKVAPATLVDNLVVSLSQGSDSNVDNVVVSLSLPTSVMKIFEQHMIDFVFP